MVVPLDRNENLYGPSPLVIEAIRRIPIERISLYGPYYCSRLQNSIGDYFNVQDESVILGYGAEMLLQMFFERLVRKNNQVSLPELRWHYYDVLAQRFGARVIPIALRRTKSGFHYHYEADKHRQSNLLIVTTPIYLL